MQLSITANKMHPAIIFNGIGENKEVRELLRLEFLRAIDWLAMPEPHRA